MKKILFGAGEYGVKALRHYGKENVAFFCDNLKYGEDLEGIPIISYKELLACYKEYEVVICAYNLESIYEIAEMLKGYQIPYIVYHREDNYEGLLMLHIKGEYPNIQYDYVKDAPEEGRIIKFKTLLEKTLKAYPEVFSGKSWICG